MNPHIADGWIYSMVVLGFIGTLITFGIILTSGYFTFNLIPKQDLQKTLLLLYFTIWTGNFLACFNWAFLRSNLFHTITKQSCIGIYIFNYLCYMIAKLCIHILLLYRLFIAFQGTLYQINITFIRGFIALIIINFFVFTSLWIQICVKDVTVGIGTYSKTLQICTLYNNDSHFALIPDEIFPILFGGQDFLVGLTTLIIFVKKISDIAATAAIHDIETETLIRKLTLLGSMAICSTFIFYTFAVPLYPNLTFLLPFDATLNSLCIVLLLEYSHSVYMRLCFCLDVILKKSLHHQDAQKEESLLEINQLQLNISIDDNNINKYESENSINKVNNRIKGIFEKNTSVNIKSCSCMDLNNINIKPLPLAQSKYSHSAFL